MALSSRRNSAKGSSRKRKSSSSGAAPRKKKQKSARKEEEAAAEEPFYKVAKIVGTKIGKGGITLYKTRWEGYTAGDDTWEPLENVAGTGHVDRYERKQRALTLSTYTAGVAVIEYDDGERQTVDLLQEKFRSWMEISDDERDDDTVTGDDDVNNFHLIRGGAMIELLWPHAQIYFSCKVISWTPIVDSNDNKKSVVKRNAPSMSIALLAEGAAAGCRKCQLELKSGEASRRKHNDHCPVLKKRGGRPADRLEKTKSNEDSIKKNSNEDSKKKERTEREVAIDDKRNDSLMNEESRSGENESAIARETDEAPVKKKKKGRSGERESKSTKKGESDKEVSAKDKTNEGPSKKKKSRSSEEEHSVEVASNKAPLQNKKSRSIEKESAAKVNSGASHSKKRSRPGEKKSAIEGGSDDAPSKKKNRSIAKEVTEVATMKAQNGHAEFDKKRSISSKASAQGKPTKKDKQRKKGRSASLPGLMRDVSSDDDNSDSITKTNCKRNVSEGSDDASSFCKVSTSASTARIKESLPDDMDIDALAALVSMRQSVPTVHTAVNSATNKNDAKNDGDSQLHCEDKKRPSKQKAKEKVGRGVPLYSDDEYESSDNEWRGEKDFFQPAARPRDGPKLSFEEMWMKKLEQTQVIMDRNNVGRRW